MAFVFKLLTDAIILDDFKTALDKLSQRHRQRLAVDPQLGGHPLQTESSAGKAKQPTTMDEMWDLELGAAEQGNSSSENGV